MMRRYDIEDINGVKTVLRKTDPNDMNDYVGGDEEEIVFVTRPGSIRDINERILRMTPEWKENKRKKDIRNLRLKIKHFQSVEDDIALSIARGDVKDELEKRWQYEREISYGKFILDLTKKMKWLKAKPEDKNKKQEINIESIANIPIKDMLANFGHRPNDRGWYICPLNIHTEKTPSFHIQPGKNKFKCFSCGESGSVIDLMVKINNSTVAEAIKKLKNYL